MATVESIKEILKRISSDFRVEGYKDFGKALDSAEDIKLVETGIDSLDQIELVMAVEDELNLHLDDYKLESTFNDFTLVKDIPGILFKALP